MTAPVTEKTRIGGDWPCPACGSNRRRVWARALRPGIGALTVYRCKTCGLGRLSPRVTYDYREEGEVSDDTLRTDALGQAAARVRLRRLADYRGTSGGRLLEIGGSHAAFADAAKEAGYEVFEVELSEASAKQIARHGHHVFCGPLAEAPFPVGSFDVACSFHVLEHVDRPGEFLRNVVRFVRPGGVVFLEVPLLQSLRARLLGPAWTAIYPQHLLYFSKPTLLSLLSESGVVEIAGSGDTSESRFGILPRELREPLRGLFRAAYDAVPVNDVYSVLGRKPTGVGTFLTPHLARTDATPAAVRVDGPTSTPARTPLGHGDPS